MTYNTKRAEKEKIDGLNLILSGRPRHAQQPLLNQLSRFNQRLKDVQLPRGKINSHLWKLVGGIELANRHNLDVMVQYDDDIYAVLSFVLMNQIPSDQLKTVAMGCVIENPSTKFLSKKQRQELEKLGIYFATDLMSGARMMWEKISTGEYKKLKA